MHYGRLAAGTLLAMVATSQAVAAPNPATAPQRKVEIDLSGEVQYDTNFPRVSAAEAALRHQTREETTYVPSINLDIFLPISRESVFLNGSAGYSFHTHNTLQDSERINLEGGGNARFGICQTQLTGDYQRNLSDFEDISAATTITNILEVKRVGLSAHCARRTGLGVQVSGSHEWSDNSTSLLVPQDHRSDTISGGLTYARPALGTVTLFGSHTRTEFPNRLVGLGRHDGYNVDAGGVTVDRRFGARVEGTATVSYTSVNSLGPPIPGVPSSDFSGVTYTGDLTYRATRRLRAELVLERAIVPSNRIGNSYDLRTRYRLTGTYDLNPRIQLSLGGEKRDIDSTANLPPTVIALTNSQTNVGFGSVRYSLSKRIFLTLDGGLEQRSTNNPLFNYRDTHVAVSAHVRY